MTYLHHKGGRYSLLFVATESTNDRAGNAVCVYVSLTTGRIHTRDALEFHEQVIWPDGSSGPRFRAEL